MLFPNGADFQLPPPVIAGSVKALNCALEMPLFSITVMYLHGTELRPNSAGSYSKPSVTSQS